MLKNIDFKIIPDRLQWFKRASEAGIVTSIVFVVIDFIQTSMIDRYVKYGEALPDAYDALTFFTYLLIIINIAITVFSARALNNVYHFLKNKYGSGYTKIKANGAGVWLWFIPLGMFWIKDTVTPKNEDGSIFSKTGSFIKKGMFLLFFATLIDRYIAQAALKADTIETLWGITFFGVITGAMSVLSFVWFRKYAVEFIKEIENNPDEYVIPEVKRQHAVFSNQHNTRNIDSENIEKIKQLNELKQSGILTEEEFESLKKRELGL